MRTRTGGTAARLGVAVVAMAALGCSSIAEQATEELVERAIEAEGGGQVDLDSGDGSMTIETEDGTMTMGTGDVPPEIDDIFDLPSGLTVMSVITGTQSGVDNAALTASAPGDPKELAADLIEDAEASGWVVAARYEVPEGIQATFTRDDGETLDLSIMSDGDGGVLMTIFLSRTAG